MIYYQLFFLFSVRPCNHQTQAGCIWSQFLFQANANERDSIKIYPWLRPESVSTLSRCVSMRLTRAMKRDGLLDAFVCMWHVHRNAISWSDAFYCSWERNTIRLRRVGQSSQYFSRLAASLFSGKHSVIDRWIEWCRLALVIFSQLKDYLFIAAIKSVMLINRSVEKYTRNTFGHRKLILRC